MYTPSLIALYFYLFSFMAALGAVGVVALRNIFHSALAMVVCLFATAGLFVLLNAEFLAAVQVIIYVGAITVLIIFAILVSQGIMRKNIIQTNAYSIPGAIAAAFLFCVTTWVAFMTPFVDIIPQIYYPPWWGQVPAKLDNTQLIGWSLMTTYTLGFEVASILLLMALIGSMVLATHREGPD